MTIGNRIKSLRESKNMNQSETVNAINAKYGTKINGAMWSKWENDRDTPSLDNLRIISKYFNATLDYLSGRTDESHEEIPTEKNALLDYFHKNPDLKILFSITEDLSEEKIKYLIALAKTMKGE